jgi:hypothetical protein
MVLFDHGVGRSGGQSSRITLLTVGVLIFCILRRCLFALALVTSRGSSARASSWEVLLMNRLSCIRPCVLGPAICSLTLVSAARSAPVESPTNLVPSESAVYAKQKGGGPDGHFEVAEGNSFVVVTIPYLRLSNAIGGVTPPTSPGVFVESIFDVNYDFDWIFDDNGSISTGSGHGTAAGSRLYVGGLSYDAVGAAIYDTELLELRLAGLNGLPPGVPSIILRESPTKESKGQTSIKTVPVHLFSIDSFYDVFTELSIDGGQTWYPASSLFHLESVPEPSACALATSGLIGLAAGGRRRRR